MASASSETEPELQLAPTSTRNMKTLTARAIHRARRNNGSTDGGCGEQQEADMVLSLESGWLDWRPYSRYKVNTRGSSKMRIGELAAKAACDVQTVHYYEREG